MRVERLIGIVIPEEIKKEADSFCTRFAPGLTEPYMALVTPDKLESVRGIDRKMQSFCLSQPPFKTIIGGPNLEHSDNGTILYLSVMMGPLNTARGRLMKHLKIPAGAFFRAQLMLISGKADSNYDFDMILEDAKKTFVKAREFSVRALAVYSKKDGDMFFTIDSEYPFTGR